MLCGIMVTFPTSPEGMRKKADADNTIPAIMPNELSSKKTRQNWARLIQKNYEVDPLVCLKYQGHMRTISIIDDFEIIDKILTHLNLLDIRNHDPPPLKVSYHVLSLVCGETDFRIPVFNEWY